MKTSKKDQLTFGWDSDIVAEKKRFMESNSEKWRRRSELRKLHEENKKLRIEWAKGKIDLDILNRSIITFNDLAVEYYNLYKIDYRR